MFSQKPDLIVSKLKRINKIDSDSFFGLTAALFLVLLYNFYLFHAFFAMSDWKISLTGYLGLIWFVIFFMVQAGILRTINHSLGGLNFKIYSILSVREFIRFIGTVLFAAIFFLFILGYYPLKMYESNILTYVIFYAVSFLISIIYWKYVENYKEGQINLPRLGEYPISAKFTIILILIIFGGIATFIPYSLFGLIGTGIWFLMLSRLMLEK